MFQAVFILIIVSSKLSQRQRKWCPGALGRSDRFDRLRNLEHEHRCGFKVWLILGWAPRLVIAMLIVGSNEHFATLELAPFQLHHAHSQVWNFGNDRVPGIAHPKIFYYSMPSQHRRHSLTKVNGCRMPLGHWWSAQTTVNTTCRRVLLSVPQWRFCIARSFTLTSLRAQERRECLLTRALCCFAVLRQC